MLVIPAIDILDGKCVRLRQGEFNSGTIYDAAPTEAARRWIDAGAEYLHLVDLDAAKTGSLVHRHAIRAIAALARKAGVKCQVGGGIRKVDVVQEAHDLGVDRLVVGTSALEAPEWFAQAAERFPGKLLLGLDAKNGMVATWGWTEVSNCTAVELAKRLERLPLAGIVYTDVSRDGMMSGPNFGAIKELATNVALPIIASGGVATLDDVRALQRLPVAGCIIGRALYEGTLDLREVLAL